MKEKLYDAKYNPYSTLKEVLSMKVSIRFVFLSVIMVVTLNGCAITPKAKPIWVNPKVSSENRQAVLNRDGNQCHREALIKLSSVDTNLAFRKTSYNYYRGLYSGSTTPVYGNSGNVIGSVVLPNSQPSIGEAFTYGLRRAEADRSSLRGSYNSRMLAYIKSCMASKGWRQK